MDIKIALEAGDKLGIDWTQFPKDEFLMGMSEEEEHADVTHGDPTQTAKIVLAHLKEDPQYYTKLGAAMSKKAMGWEFKAILVDRVEGIIEGIIAPYYGPANGTDLAGWVAAGKSMDANGNIPRGDYFDERTDFGANKSFPMLFHHGQDPTIGKAPIGQFVASEPTKLGQWGRAILDKANAYMQDIMTLVELGKLKFSSGADPSGIVREPDGHIKSWPIKEASLSYCVINPDQPLPAIKAMAEKAVEEAVYMKDIKAITEKEGAPKSPPKGYPTDRSQYADPKNYKYPIDNEKHVRAALSYFNHSGQRSAGGYNEAEWAEIGGRIARAASDKLGAPYEYKNEKVEAKEMKGNKAIPPIAAPACEHNKDGACTKPGGVCDYIQAGKCMKADATVNTQPQTEGPIVGGATNPQKVNDGGQVPPPTVAKCNTKDELMLPGNVVEAAINLYEALERLIPGIENMEDAAEGEAVEDEAVTGTEPIAPTTNPGVSQGMGGENHVKSLKAAIKAHKAALKSKKAMPGEMSSLDQFKALLAEHNKPLLDKITELSKEVSALKAMPVPTEGKIVIRGRGAANGSKLDDVNDPMSVKAALEVAMKNTPDEGARRALSMQLAMMETQDVIAQGPQTMRQVRG